MERNGLTGKVTIEVDLKDFGRDLDYEHPFEELLKEGIASHIRSYIRESFLKEHKKKLNNWAEEYMRGKHPADPDGVVMLSIPIELIK